MDNNIESQVKNLACQLRKEREKKHISQIDLALKADLSQNIVAFIENGKRVPNVQTLFKLCNALEINPAVLFEPNSEEKENAKKEIISFINKYF